MKAKRNPNIELLRIVSILLVLLSHCISHSNANSGLLLNPEHTITFNHIFSVFAGTWGRLAVEVFIFISAYYMVDKEGGFRSKKIIKIGVQAWFWCIVIMCFVYGFRLREVSMTDVIKEFLTPAYPQYWFITNYILFYLLVPFLQLLVNKLKLRQLKCLVVLLTCMIACFRMAESVSNLVYFGYLFIVAAFLKRDEGWFERKRKIILPIMFIMSVCLKFMIYDFDLFTGRELPGAILSGIEMLSGFVTSIMAISLFYNFKCWKCRFITGGEAISRLSRATLGVYIIHENILLRGSGGQSALLWDNIFHIGDAFYTSNMFIIRVFFAVAVVYVFYMLIENIRIEIIDKRIIEKFGWLDKICKKIDGYFQ